MFILSHTLGLVSLFADWCGIIQGSYRYTSELLELERRSAPPSKQYSDVRGFLPQAEWEPFLSSHPDRVFASYLHRGIRFGFQIGFSTAHQLKHYSKNHNSVASNPRTVDEYIQKELENGKLMVAPNPSSIHISPIGIIAKPHQPGKFRLIVDLSSPAGGSVNDGIPTELCSLVYATVEEAASLVKGHGKGALMSKLDLMSAYRMVPIHPQDQWLLGIIWKTTVLVDRALPFGLRSAPKIFNSVADGLAWAMSCAGIVHPIHYLDDFFFCGPAHSPVCQVALDTAIPLCHRLGLPVAPTKVEGPTTCLTFLGIEIDSVAQELRLPPEKLRRLISMLSEWEGRRSATKHQLQSLIGHLSHASKVVKPGRPFMRELIRTMAIPKASFHLVCLNTQCRADIMWWSTFLSVWNGISLFPGMPLGSIVTSDASGSWGCGAFQAHPVLWFQLQWPSQLGDLNIAIKELIPIVISAAIWGHAWHNQRVVFRSDNMAVVHTLVKSSTKDPFLAHLIRCLTFFEAHFNFEDKAEHVAGKANIGADALSRGDVTNFFSFFPQARLQPPHQVPEALIQLLMNPDLSWTSQHWKANFRAILSAVSPSPQ